MFEEGKKEDWVVKHTLTQDDVRRLISETLERARLQQLAEENRKATESEPA